MTDNPLRAQIADWLETADGSESSARVAEQILGGFGTVILATLSAPAQGAVGEAGSMPGTAGFTMAVFKASEVPVGTPLYSTPPTPPGNAALVAKAIHEGLRRSGTVVMYSTAFEKIVERALAKGVTDEN